MKKNKLNFLEDLYGTINSRATSKRKWLQKKNNRGSFRSNLSFDCFALLKKNNY